MADDQLSFIFSTKKYIKNKIFSNVKLFALKVMKKFIVAFISERTGKQITTPWKLLFGAFAGLIGMIWDKIH